MLHKSFHCAILAIAGCCAMAAAQIGSSFVRTGDMTTARSGHTATLLADGTVLITGGKVAPADQSISSAELYDPSTGSFAPTGNMTAARRGHTATLLPDGKVLIAGGLDFGPPSAELYDPATRTFTAIGAMIQNRIFHAATLLPNGKVLIAGGSSSLNAELYDPETGTFSLTGEYAERLKFSGFTNTANSLPDGKVLIAGENPPMIYDPTSGTFSTTGTMAESVYHPGVEWHAGTSLRDGTVLITGGNDDGTCGGFANAEIYDPASGTFSVTGKMMTSRDIHTATLLRDGTVLLAGGGEGWCGHPTLDSGEVYDPASRSFVAVGKMTQSRSGHTATLLNDGTVLITGGFSNWSAGTARSAELYRPAPSEASGRKLGRR
jgi:WD40 repeat protein